MKSLFDSEHFAARLVTFVRSNFAYIILLCVTLLFTLPATALQATKIISLAYKDTFDMLIEMKLIEISDIAIISGIMGFALAVLFETAGAIFSIRGRHIVGLYFAATSSITALTTFLHTYHYTDPNVINNTLFAIVVTCNPVLITYLIGKDLAQKSNTNEVSVLETYSGAVHSRMTAEIKKVISNFKI